MSIKKHHRRRTEEEYMDEIENTIARIVKSKREMAASITEGEWLSYLGNIGTNVSNPNVWQYMLEVREQVEDELKIKVVQKKNGQISFIDKLTHKFMSWKKPINDLQQRIDLYKRNYKQKRLAK